MERAPVEHRVPVSAWLDDLKHSRLRGNRIAATTWPLVGDRELPAANAIEEEHARQQRVTQAARGAHVLVEMEPDRNVIGVGAPDPPLGAPAPPPRCGDRPESLDRLFDGVRGALVPPQPEGREVALPQPTRAEPRNRAPRASDDRGVERVIDHPRQRRKNPFRIL